MNPIFRFVELKRQEALLAPQLEAAKSEAIAYYKANPVLTDPKKLTGVFTNIEGVDLQAKVTWKQVKTSLKNPEYTARTERLVEIEGSLKTIHAEKLAGIEAQIEALKKLSASYLINEETEKLKAELQSIPATKAGTPKDELSVELPKG
jgi:plasmid replication initiation protein